MLLLVELVELKEKHMARVEELDVLHLEVEELRSRPPLLGACTSCPNLHARFLKSHAKISSLEAALKSPSKCLCLL
jgi:hypothetical protein